MLMRALSAHAVVTAPMLLAPLAASLVIIVLGTWLCYRAYFDAASNAALPPATAGERVTAEAPVAPQRVLGTLADSRLFGSVEMTPVAEPEPAAPDVADDGKPPEVLPLATMGVTVQGIVFHDENGRSYVMLAGPGTEDRAYRVGDELNGGVTIRFIETRRVVVDHAGELEELPLVRLSDGGAGMAPRAALRPQISARVRRTMPRPSNNDE